MRAATALRRAAGSVRVRVTLLAALAFAIVMLLTSAFLLRALEDRLVDDVRDADAAALREQAFDVAVAGLPAPDALQQTVPIAGTNTVAFQVISSQGLPIVVFTDRGIGTGAQLPPPTGDILDSTEAATFFELAVDAGPGASGTVGARRVSVPLDASARQLLGVGGTSDSLLVSTLRVGNGVSLATASSLDEVAQVVTTTRTVLWIAGPCLVLLVALLAWVLVGRALRPVHALTSRVASISSDSLHERVPVPPTADEIGELATTMNSMLARLEESAATNRRLVSDASHELRTPLAVVRTELEVARLTSGADWETICTNLLGEVDRMQDLVDDLLLLARTAERGLETSEVDVVDIVRDVASRRRRVDVRAELDVLDDEPHRVLADGAALRRALDHVVANAARHATTEVTVDVVAADDAVELRVDDDGPGIPAAERERVLERFVRLDEGRARDHGGSGLGLAVAHDVVTALGGKLHITDAPAGGARVVLALPTAAPAPARFPVTASG
jgi:signal transduction histidine kinase